MDGLTEQDRRGLVTTLAGGMLLALAVWAPTSRMVLGLCGAVVFQLGLLRIRFQ